MDTPQHEQGRAFWHHHVETVCGTVSLSRSLHLEPAAPAYPIPLAQPVCTTAGPPAPTSGGFWANRVPVIFTED